MAQRQRFDPGRIDLPAAAIDYILEPAAEAQISLVVDPAKIAGHKPSVAVERLLGRGLIVEIPEHQARAAAADLTDFAARRLDIRFVLAPDLDFVSWRSAHH